MASITGVRYRGRRHAFRRTGANLPDGSIPGYVVRRKARVAGRLEVRGDGFHFVPAEPGLRAAFASVSVLAL